LLSIEHLSVEFETDRGVVRAVNGVSLSVAAGETLGLVGESGCGKSVTGLSILRLLPSPPGRITGGRIAFEGEDVLAASMPRMREIRGAAISMIFQDPLSALNPVMTSGRQVMELVQAHERVGEAQARERMLTALRDAGLPDPAAAADAYPHELSGGMRQRVMIAMAIVLRPQLVIADEPTTAVDVTVQAQLISLFQRLKATHGMALLLISHDLGVVAQLADRIAVMYAGHVVEEAPTKELFRSPRHPYTRGLLDSIPSRQAPGTLPQGIPGTVPDPVTLPSGCPFHPRCPRRVERCPQTFPMTELQEASRFACYNPEPHAHAAP